MVGIVFVSHSAQLAEGVRELVDQMVQGRVPLAVAGGIDDPDNPIGTDPMKVYEAIMSVYGDDGVVVLMDLGSALLSAEMALEFLDPAQKENVSLSAAPFVEGAMAAAVQASVGGSRHQVLAEAQGALAMKVDHLRKEPELVKQDANDRSENSGGRSKSTGLTIRNKQGLHARPAAKFVRKANEFAADIQVFKGSQQANAKSINQVATLEIRQGDEIRIVATGSDAGQAIVALQALVESDFAETTDETETASVATADTVPLAEGVLGGIAVSPGKVIGPAILYRPNLSVIVQKAIDDPDLECARFQEAVSLAIQEIEDLQVRVNRQLGLEEAAIFQTHALFLQDPALVDKVKQRILTELVNAETAWAQAISAAAEEFRGLESQYMQARAADVEDVGQRVLHHLLGIELPSLNLDQPSIVVAADLSPSETAQLDSAKVLGFCVELGGATSHSAILARALGIPAVAGLGIGLWAIGEGDIIAIDGHTGQLSFTPVSHSGNLL